MHGGTLSALWMDVARQSGAERMRIGVLAASSVANPDVIAPVSAFAVIAYPEVDLVFHPQCYAHDGHFAGSDAVRAAALAWTPQAAMRTSGDTMIRSSRPTGWRAWKLGPVSAK
ncbi:hypothetical protein LTR94_034498, partial [Friedmanniomyces endolithicus]